MKIDVLIIGAGASGLMCAISAGRRGRSVAVVDHAGKVCSKVRVSGGGRCNFTNLNIDSSRYISSNPHFVKSALSGFTPQHIVDMLKNHGIGYLEKEEGQLFCDSNSGRVVNMLLTEAKGAGIQILTNCKVIDIKKTDGLFRIRTSKGDLFSESLVVATGGASYKELGASGFGYAVARQFGHNVTAMKPGLVPLVFSREDRRKFSDLSGVSFRAAVSFRKTLFTGYVLFTHRGLSGPAVLQVSSFWSEGEKLTIDLLPDIDIHRIFIENHQNRTEMHNLLSGYLSRRLARRWCDIFIPSRPLCQYDETELFNAARLLHAWELTPHGTEGYGRAEVTVGGVNTEGLSSKTMGSKIVPGLYFTGEVVDVTGMLGGYNLHWAWASGHAAGQYA